MSSVQSPLTSVATVSCEVNGCGPHAASCLSPSYSTQSLKRAWLPLANLIHTLATLILAPPITQGVGILKCAQCCIATCSGALGYAREVAPARIEVNEEWISCDGFITMPLLELVTTKCFGEVPWNVAALPWMEEE